MKVSERLRQNAHEIWEANYHHPFVQAIGDGTLTEERANVTIKKRCPADE